MININNLNTISKVFDQSILDIIETGAYYVYFINRNKQIKCSCISHETKQANLYCPKCLGTGNKIKIYKAKVAAQDTKLPPTFRGDTFIVARNYYVPSKYVISEEDLIVDKNEVYICFEIQNLLSLKGTIPYSKVNASKKRFDSDKFFKNFYKIIKNNGDKNDNYKIT